MVTLEVLVTAVLGVAGLAISGAGFLYRRDQNHKEELKENIEANADAVEELDTAFGRMAQRLFGHPKDETDDGALMSREERVRGAEEDIHSLSDEVQHAKEAAEENGDAIEELADRQNEYAEQTRGALRRIEEQLDASLIPGDDDFLSDDGSGSKGD